MTRIKPLAWNGVPIPYDEPIEALRGSLRSPGPAAWAAIRALSEKPGRDALAVLTEFAGHPDAHIRRAVVEAIGLHDCGRSAAGVVLAALRDPDGFVVRAGCEASARLALVGAHDVVLGLIPAREEATRLAALQALEKLWVGTDFDAVFARYLHDPSDRVRKQAAWVLHEHVDRKRWEVTFAAWSKDLLPRHRVWACDLSGQFGGESALADLAALGQDVDGHVRWAAQRAVAQITA